ncbi:hypothetical protein VP01_362g8 [Puccinia sorghi]|uniref:Uncharacterized protein n=1 Tax=Puccinia sorghi TaxID=27349 RepID=A0A0L6UUQ3_9BASI|nr:hypothetical protein VP01_362g8 [Puccinia sorghi]
MIVFKLCKYLSSPTQNKEFNIIFFGSLLNDPLKLNKCMSQSKNNHHVRESKEYGGLLIQTNSDREEDTIMGFQGICTMVCIWGLEGNHHFQGILIRAPFYPTGQCVHVAFVFGMVNESNFFFWIIYHDRILQPFATWHCCLLLSFSCFQLIWQCHRSLEHHALFQTCAALATISDCKPNHISSEEKQPSSRKRINPSHSNVSRPITYSKSLSVSLKSAHINAYPPSSFFLLAQQSSPLSNFVFIINRTLTLFLVLFVSMLLLCFFLFFISLFLLLDKTFPFLPLNSSHIHPSSISSVSGFSFFIIKSKMFIYNNVKLHKQFFLNGEASKVEFFREVGLQINSRKHSLLGVHVGGVVVKMILIKGVLKLMVLVRRLKIIPQLGKPLASPGGGYKIITFTWKKCTVILETWFLVSENTLKICKMKLLLLLQPFSKSDSTKLWCTVVTVPTHLHMQTYGVGMESWLENAACQLQALFHRTKGIETIKTWANVIHYKIDNTKITDQYTNGRKAKIHKLQRF